MTRKRSPSAAVRAEKDRREPRPPDVGGANGERDRQAARHQNDGVRGAIGDLGVARPLHEGGGAERARETEGHEQRAEEQHLAHQKQPHAEGRRLALAREFAPRLAQRVWSDANGAGRVSHGRSLATRGETQRRSGRVDRARLRLGRGLGVVIVVRLVGDDRACAGNCAWAAASSSAIRAPWRAMDRPARPSRRSMTT